ncbi:MAG TPA: porin family protein [Chitinispirillaceae bacterium]|nr:porin family protein [Chitinispirillaceae bacterium]
MMRSSYCLKAFLLIFSTTSAFSQIQQERLGLSIGVRSGFSVSSYWGNGVSSFEKDLSLSVNGFKSGVLPFFTSGFFVQYEIIPDFFAIQPEISFLRSGKRWEISPVDGGKTNFQVYSDYLHIPLLAKLIIPFVPVTPSAYVGPSLLLRLKSRSESVAELSETADLGFLRELTSDKAVSKIIYPLDLGLTTGFALDIIAGTGRFLIDLRYTFGMFDVFHGGKDFRNSAFSLLAGYAWSY